MQIMSWLDELTSYQLGVRTSISLSARGEEQRRPVAVTCTDVTGLFGEKCGRPVIDGTARCQLHGGHFVRLKDDKRTRPYQDS